MNVSDFREITVCCNMIWNIFLQTFKRCDFVLLWLQNFFISNLQIGSSVIGSFPLLWRFHWQVGWKVWKNCWNSVIRKFWFFTWIRQYRSIRTYHTVNSYNKVWFEILNAINRVLSWYKVLSWYGCTHFLRRSAASGKRKTLLYESA